jgi:hypothetical protein
MEIVRQRKSESSSKIPRNRDLIYTIRERLSQRKAIGDHFVFANMNSRR